MMENTGETFGEVIYSYSRKQAIEDGVLVDLSTLYPHETRIYKWSVACTETVWNLILDACNDDVKEAGPWVRDICRMSSRFPTRFLSEREQLFKVTLGHKTHTLKIHCGPGDTMVPVITVMLPEED